MKTQGRTSQKKGEAFDNLMPLLEAMYGEFKELGKKKPDAAVSKSKILVANRLLEKLREILADESSMAFLDLLDPDDVPQASDVTLMFSQYVAAMSAFKSRYHGYNGTEYAWFVK